MALLYNTEEYYKNLIQLQNKLRKSEEERLLLELKFHEITQESRNDQHKYFKKMDKRYQSFLKQDQVRQSRNEEIVRGLEQIEARIGKLSAKTDRFNSLRKQYHTYMDSRYNFNRCICNIKPQGATSQFEDEIERLSNVFDKLNKRKVVAPEEKSYMMRKPAEYEYIPSENKFSTSKSRDLLNYDSNLRTNDIYKTEPKLYSDDNRLLFTNNDDKCLQNIKDSKQVLQSDIGFDSNRLVDDVNGLDYKLSKELEISPQRIKMIRKQDDSFEQEGENQSAQSKISKTMNQTNLTPTFYKQDQELSPLQIQEQVLPRKEQIDQMHFNQSKEPISPLKLHPAPNEEQNQSIPQSNFENDQNLSKPIKTFPQYDDDKSKYNQDLDINRENMQPVSEYGPNLHLNSQSTVQYEEIPQSTFEYDQNLTQNIVSTPQFDQIIDQNQQQFDKHGQDTSQYDPIGQTLPQYDGISQPNLDYESNVSQNIEAMPQYNENQPQYDPNTDKNSQLLPQNNEIGQSLPQYLPNIDQTEQPILPIDEQNQPITQSNPNVDPNTQPTPQCDKSGQLIQQYDPNSNPDSQQFPQYDENGQEILQYDPIIEPNEEQYPQYAENVQPIQQYDHNLNSNSQLFPQYDENGQEIPQYDPNLDPNGGQYPQYDENGQPLIQYDENGQPIPQYDGNGELIVQYDGQYEQQQQYDENGQPIMYQYDGSESYGGQYDQTEQVPESATMEQPVEEPILVENTDKKEEEPRLNVMEMLDTDTESSNKPDSQPKVSNDSDFDFST